MREHPRVLSSSPSESGTFSLCSLTELQDADGAARQEPLATCKAADQRGVSRCRWPMRAQHEKLPPAPVGRSFPCSVLRSLAAPQGFVDRKRGCQKAFAGAGKDEIGGAEVRKEAGSRGRGRGASLSWCSRWCSRAPRIGDSLRLFMGHRESDVRVRDPRPERKVDTKTAGEGEHLETQLPPFSSSGAREIEVRSFLKS